MRYVKWSILSLAILAPVAATNCPGLLNPSSVNPKDDWLLFASHHLFARRCWVELGQVPLYSPYFCGGYPMAANPESPVLSPLIVFTLLFGEQVGMKLPPIFWGVVGAWGALGLARYVMRLSWASAALAAAVLGSITWTQAVLASGNPNVLCFCATPLMLWGLLRGGRAFGAGVALLAVALVDGALACATMTLALTVLVVLLSLRYRTRRLSLRTAPYLRLVLLVAIASGLCALKILPMLELIGATGSVQQPRQSYHTAAYSPDAVSAYRPSDLASSLVGSGRRLHVGWGVLALAAFGLVQRPRICWQWAALLTGTALMTTAHHAPYDVFLLARMLPVFGAINSTVKYFDYFVVLSLVMMAAAGCESLGTWLPRKRPPRTTAWCALTLLCLAPALWSSMTLNHRTFRVSAPKAATGEPLHHVRGWRVTYGRDAPKHWNAYVNLQRNVGTLDLPAPIRLPVRPVPKYLVSPAGHVVTNPLYQGEAQGAQIERMTPNLIRLRDVEENACLNLNFLPGWRAQSKQGLLATGAAAAPKVELAYVPRSFKFGLITSLAVACLAMARLMAKVVAVRTRRPTRMCILRCGPQALGCIIGILLIVAGAVLTSIDQWHLEPKRLAAREYTSGLALFDGGQFGDAAPHFREAANAAPEHLQAEIKLAQCLIHLGRHEEAAQYLEALARQWPYDAVVHNTLGLACMQMGQHRKALDSWRTASRVEPLNPDAYVNIAYAAAGAGRADLAGRMLLRAAVNGFDDIESLREDPTFGPLFRDGSLSELTDLIRGLRHKPARAN